MSVSAQRTRDYYEEFSLAVGLRDWLIPNPRHRHLRITMKRLLRHKRGLRILDVGAGAGVVTSSLARFGDVTAIDFSESALTLARSLVPGVTFLQGSLDSLPRASRWDVITLFDVLEHIPRSDRPAFLSELAARLSPQGLVVFSTPHPAFTRWRRCSEADTLQIVDEEVQADVLLGEAGRAGLQLLTYEAFDIWRGSPEYQLFVFTVARRPGGSAQLRSRSLRRYMTALRIPGTAMLHRVTRVLMLLPHQPTRATVRWLLTGRAPTVRN